ncbi:MAG: preprotein translocase subunit SecA [Armatimonadota bacterium]|nr:MAG: preprotein translocase subunit SecA [Armatimonadota bacterium]
MQSVFTSLFDITRRDLRRMWPMARRITALEPQIQQLSDAKLRAKTDEFKQRVADGETLDDLLVEAFAVVREAAVRTIGMRHFDVQLIGGMVLHEGKIAEMKTGEGKTLVATLPIYLNALTGKGTHLATHNDYLAKRDREWMGPVYEFLGLTVGLVQHDMDEQTRKEAYQADITYGTNTEFGFDYLRDNMRTTLELVVQRGHTYAIVDEVDSLLIDEARTPLIISGPGQKPTALYKRVDGIVRRLAREQDYVVDEKAKTATLTDEGVRKVEGLLNIQNLSDPENVHIFQHVNAAIRAHACYKLDVDYVVREGQVILVDEFTGRLMFGRRYAEGLHQAIEAKEGVKIERESQTLATVSIQNYFRMYDKLAGMTGTAKTEEQEFAKIYGLPVVVIPTNKPMIRADNPDVVHKTEEAKFRGITGEILQLHSRGQPVLVGTRSIEVSEHLGQRLSAENLQLFARLMLLHDKLLDTPKLDESQSRELRAALRERLNGVERERARLQEAVEMFELNPSRPTPPEEMKQIEHRLKRVAATEAALAGAIEKLEAGQDLGGEIRRIADLITYEKLEDVRVARLPALCQAFGIPPDPCDEDNVRALAGIIGLDGHTYDLRAVLQQGIPHQVLNAKYHEMEAQIIAQAGRSGTVTIATNMAGRGVDILLGGSREKVAADLLRERGSDPDGDAAEEIPQEEWQRALAESKQICEDDRQRVLESGGLHILGTERHESRRIDNQLRGRSGRQGDPGSSRFYVSLEDELMRLFAPERLDFLLGGWEECAPLASRIVSRTIENAQHKVEIHNFSMRQHLLKYDDVKNLQREVIYRQRRKVLAGADLRESILASLSALVESRVGEHASSEVHPGDWDLDMLHQSLYEIFPIHFYMRPEDLREIPPRDIVERIQELAVQAYEDRERQLTPEVVRDLERMITLRTIDTKWIDHLDSMDFLEEGIGLRGYAGVDPLVAFQKEAYTEWEALQATMQEEIVKLLFRVEVVKERVRPQPSPFQHMHASHGGDEEPQQRQPERVKKKVGRNDPCPCGSGKKYKKCCLNKA